ncbi:radical SAM protein, partial [archaeon]|nr:radical SAM protein [archaeon]
TYWYPGVFSAIRILKESFPGIPVILGGIYATLCRDHAVRYSGAHHIISGEGEIAVLKTLTELWGADPGFVPDMDDLDSLPRPLFDLVEPMRYVSIQTTRGCPYRCSYCASHLLNRGLRRRNPVRVADEIDFWVKEQDIADFALYDDALLHDAERHAVPLMREVVKRELSIRFHCPNALHARCISQEVALLMRQSGFTTIRLGLETSDLRRQVSSGAKVTNDEFLRAIDCLTRSGFDQGDVGVYILCGLPGQEAGEVMDAVEFVKKAGARPMIAEFSPLPGTGEWEHACRSSRYDLAGDPIFQNNTILPCAWEGLTFEMYREIKEAAQQV